MKNPQSDIADTGAPDTGAPDPVARERIAAALRQHRPGYCLPRDLYVNDDVFDMEFRLLLGHHWIALGHQSRIPEKGDYFVTDVAGESLIVVRDNDNQVHVMANVCAHRGSRLTDLPHGATRALVCPYHAWTFGLDGTLLRAPSGPSDLSALHLHRFRVRVVAGVIMTCLGPDALDIEPAAEEAGRYLDPHACSDTVVAARIAYPVEANWKLVLDNFLECYHCPTAHPEYCRTNPNAYHFESGHRGERFAMQVSQFWREAREIGHVAGAVDQDCLDQSDGLEYYTCSRTPLTPGYQTATRDGKPVAPLLGTLTRFDGGETFVGIGPYSYLFGYGDYLVLFRIVPLTTTSTEMELTWLVAPGSDLLGDQRAVDELTWLWDATTKQDVVLTNRNSKGVWSRFYTPGPYSGGETPLVRWAQWYVATMASGLRG
jgi:phenylpropionate dioxygenase-like ring-hydroxylating dioxygenase large terminal subunit